MPYAQTRLWAALRKLKLNIRREAPLGRFTVDFVQHDARLVIEVDGYWHTAEGRAERDADRDEWMMSEGYLVVRIADRDVEANIATVVLQLERTINARLVSRRRERAEPLERGTGVGS